MARVTTVKVEGLAPLQRQLRQMTQEMRRKILRSATTAGARVIVLAARAKAPVKTGALKKSIGSRRDIRECKKDYEVRAVSVFRVKGIYAATKENVRRGRAGKSYMMDPPTFYWKFNELGTVKQPAKPFIEPALRDNISQVTDAVKNVLTDRIFKATKP